MNPNPFKNTPFDNWWHEIGSGLPPAGNEDKETHTRRVCLLAWNAAIGRAGLCVVEDGNPAVALDSIRRLRQPIA